jgi:hypothetical protein
VLGVLRIALPASSRALGLGARTSGVRGSSERPKIGRPIDKVEDDGEHKRRARIDN